MDYKSFHYPKLFRQDISVYYKSEGVFFETYNCKTNYENVVKDCQFRCVYCDAHMDECGGEPFSLDHFRPVDVFSEKFDGVLNIHPFNLHLSCQKCNVLKKNDWKGCLDTIDGVTFVASSGYIDRFKEDINCYLRVDGKGSVFSVDSNGPAEYMIRKLLLNRTNRVYIRNLRLVKEKAKRVMDLLVIAQSKLHEDFKNNKISAEEMKIKFEKVLRLLESFNQLQILGV
ncbi:hypothetical protein [Pantoea ananatis]|uniref:hypothetical protein n=1 Tax=Pantoea ananas TaxID=553 RepID=UPI001303E2B9|nr:hypothetical protein [Pantoea ananatis]